eukprot:TRINITY_DN2038_c0_g1_i2.p1 TRINITY_DN2038_c0_g1~~TRINITY_DN2038_c0_g1_i2.p1  ORF type:complete len:231 (+),score=43.38 TRINITY_DN2038_c0_g1_i2:132-824(+)
MSDMGEYSAWIQQTEPLPTMKKNKNKTKNKIRFSDIQIRSLETMFELETKLESRKKVQLAKELDLQPRQVAIWFQNRRARWKSKQLERDYSLLRADYDSLKSSFESLNKEKQSLLKQLQKLRGQLENPQEENKRGGLCLVGNRNDGDSDNGDVKCECNDKSSPPLGASDLRLILYSDGESIKNVEDFDREGSLQLFNSTEPAEDCSLALPEKWYVGEQHFQDEEKDVLEK